MSDLKKKLSNTKDKVAGEIKEKVGKVTGDKKLELKGKMQSTTADIKKKIDKADLGGKITDAKKDVTKKVNEMIDKNKKK